MGLNEEVDYLLRGGWDWLILLVIGSTLAAFLIYAVLTRGPEDE